MNAPRPNLTSSTIASAPAAIFFDITLDAIKGIDGTVAVTSRSAYMALSAGTMRGDCAATAMPISRTWRMNRAGLEVDGQPRHRLELVERAAGVRQRAAAQLRHLHAARRRERGRDQRHLVADAAGRVLVDLDALDRAEVEHLAAAHHRLRQRERLDAGHAADAHRHQPGGHLVVGDVAEEVSAEQPVDLLGWMLAAVALAADHLEGVQRGSVFVVVPAGGGSRPAPNRPGVGS